MLLPVTYLGVVLIWATTPLAIQWSTASFSPLTSLALRMLISLVLVAVYAVFRGGLRLDFRRNGRRYLAGALGIFPTMLLVYFGAQFIPSGLVSLLFGLAPFMVALCSWIWLRSNPLDFLQFAALLFGLAGLGVICVDGQVLGESAHWGIILLVVATFLFALSSLMVKQWAADVAPAEQLMGSLVIAVPPLCLLALPNANPGAFHWDLQSVGALLYLSLVGSFAGYLAYYRLVQSMDVMLVALIPLITPALAMWLGYSFNGEVITPRLILGSCLILGGLALFNYRVFDLNRFRGKLRH